ncbi:sugar phosphate isomerase/epimerase family protein [Kibdelosporangium phytohabitans]|uniref:Xylose isomerase n=1 Tax=Kibdelosporangium phytohabitans TaxID=860235 RepID=A0A0N9HYV2_9PSEU|nr:TIM barrel protein [Kibdelosporangium phytohabitans]ALG08514.1 xylose isomerase [Kibdelosporangium phytohabitans]MBE1470417.1 sugar phosphate isomerase/epimerase [Kibdelosporangium phytohabitans]
MIEVGLASVTLRHKSAADVAAIAAGAGLGVVEWGGDIHVPAGDLTAASQARKLCDDNGLAVGTYGSYHKPGESDPGEFAGLVRTAVELGARRIRVWAGTRASADAGPHYRAEVTSALRRCADLAGQQGIPVTVEYHVESLTDDIDSALAMYAEAGSAGLVAHWQPRESPIVGQCLAEVRALLPALASVHAFSWGPDGYTERLALGAREDLWRPVFELLSMKDTVEVLLEFVPDDDVDALVRDAGTLRQLAAVS